MSRENNKPSGNSTTSPTDPALARALGRASHRSAGAWLLEWAKSIGVALVVWFFLRTFLLEAFRIPSGSMENTLLVGDFLFVNKLLYGAEVPLVGARLPAIREPRRDEILVFDSVEDKGLKVVKRLIGMPGDTLAMEDGVLIRNGTKVEEPWAVHSSPAWLAEPEQRDRMRAWQVKHLAGRTPEGYAPDLQNWGPIVVPPDSFFMMGDNRDSSYDGRYWGFLPRKNVRGTPMFIYYSFNGQSWKPLPFFSDIRWGRIFSVPR
jgi:signal peptidase I